ncbi:hypothetical protein DCAR_0520144 [Daucus carota subsp. sativus]|uniref:Uncharacterized protein n=1 Tax=Daucus carota subsp. sativus TaxID=79200 RepID=A0A164UED9_DAUCS|nr:hypothetical protein DCAR_0520144 [Daucus carota subsp. sativus]
MASSVPEGYESLSCEFHTDSALLLSQLLDESHVEDYNDERLISVIRSLEAEIIEPAMMTEDDASFMELEWDDNLVDMGNYMWDGLQQDLSNSENCSTPSDMDDLDNYNWMDMEERIGFGVVGEDYYQNSQYRSDGYNGNHHSYVTSALEEQSYGSLWQDTDVVM